MPKVTNARLGQFIKLGVKIAKLNAEKAKIRKDIIANGAMATREYVAEVETLRKETLAGKKEFIKILGPSFLKKKGLIRTYTSQEVNVVRKREHIHNIKRTARA